MCCLVLACLLAACGGNPSGTPGDVAADSRRTVDSITGDAATDVKFPDRGGAADMQDAELGEGELVECETGTTTCHDGSTAAACQKGKWVVTQVCGGEMICLQGGCVPAEECQAGHVAGCFSLSAMKVCHASGKGYVPFPCPEGEKCVNGLCGQLACNPGVRHCESATTYSECLEDGSGWSDPIPCEAGESCVGGQCLNACKGDIKYNMSNVGCEFWSVDLGQWEVLPGEFGGDPSASTIPHGVVVGNPNDASVSVTFQVGDGTPVDVPDPVVPPGQTKAFMMPVLSQQVSGVTSQSIRLRTSLPVTAAQFNPPNNEDFVHTSDASLLYPTTILGFEHYIVTFMSAKGPEMPMIGKMPSVWGYASVTAVEEGTTKVTMIPTCATESGPNFPAYGPNQVITLELQQWEVLTLNGKAWDSLQGGKDLTGTRVFSDKKVAVFSGHHCFVLGDSNCDHLETQMLPLEAWGNTYVAGRMQTPAPNQYRVVSGANDNVITTKPSVPGLDGKTLNKGEWLHAASDSSFEITGTGPLQVVQFIAGNNDGYDLVDPSMTVLIPSHQFRSDYPILVPTAYDKNFVNVVRKGDTPVFMDSNPLNAGFQPIPGTDWQVANANVSEGMVFIKSDAPIGLVSYGYATKVSYAYPAGFNAVPAGQ